MAFAKKWIALASLGAALCLGMLAGGWALAKAGAWNLEKYRSELAQLKQDCQTQRATLENMNSQTWGLELLEDKNGRFIVLPPGVKPNPQFWNVGMKKAIKLER